MTAHLPALDADDPRARSQHLLSLPPNVAPDELEVLAISRFGQVVWEEEPAAAAKPRTGILPAVTAAFGLRQATRALPKLRLGRLSYLVGPYSLQPSSAVALGLPPSSATVWLVNTPTERGEPPFAGGGDRDGLRRAFPDGLPVREEDRVVRWLVAAARRLGGAVRIADSGAVIAPDPDSAVDLTVFTSRFPATEETLAQVRRVLPRARVSGQADVHGWSHQTAQAPARGRHSHGGPVVSQAQSRIAREVLDRHGLDDETERRRLAAEAAAYDEMMAGRVVEDVYGVEADLELDGTVEVFVERLETVPTVLREALWAEEGLVALRVRWYPTDQEQSGLERPSALHRVARGRATTLVNSVAVALWDAFDGEIADEAEFLIHPEDLRGESWS